MSERRRKILSGLAVVAAIVLAVGYFVLPRVLYGSLAGLQATDSLTLYSIDGRDFAAGEEPQTAEKFHNYPVLGKIAINDSSKRTNIVRAMKNGVAFSERTFKHCFWPRHGLRAVSNGKSVDLVICFECDWLHVIVDNEQIVEHVSNAPQVLLDTYLREAGIPLAPQTLEDE